MQLFSTDIISYLLLLDTDVFTCTGYGIAPDDLPALAFLEMADWLKIVDISPLLKIKLKRSKLLVHLTFT